MWLSGSALVVLVLSLAFAVAPEALKRIGLSYLIYGCLAGFAMSWLARELQLSQRRTLILAGALLTLMGAGNVGWQSYRRFHDVRQTQFKSDADNSAAYRLLESLAAEQPADSGIARDFEALRSKFSPHFVHYLEHRVSQTVFASSPWPTMVWCSELLIAAGVAGWSIRFFLPAPEPLNPVGGSPSE